jgi:glycosyltransferase involved in cell wall biosynthesis
MKVSVLIPAYNAARFIGHAIRSVLDQSVPVELIIVDDCSTDVTADEVAGFGNRVRLLRAPRNEGAPAALNRALEAASGDLIGFNDADDLWEPGRLAAELALLTENRADAAWGQTRIFFMDEDGGSAASPEWPPRHYPALGAMLFRRSVFERLGRFDAGLRHAHDIDFLARAKEAGVSFARHDRIVRAWRRHDANLTNNVEVDRDYLATSVRLALARRRTAAAP